MDVMYGLHLQTDDLLPGNLTVRPLEKSHPKGNVIFEPSFFKGYVKVHLCTMI